MQFDGRNFLCSSFSLRVAIFRRVTFQNKISIKSSTGLYVCDPVLYSQHKSGTEPDQTVFVQHTVGGVRVKQQIIPSWTGGIQSSTGLYVLDPVLC